MGDLPKRRTVQTQNIIDAKPQLVIYGMSYHDLVSDSWNQDGVVLVHDNLKVRDDSLYLFNENELTDFETEPTPFFKKKFLRNAFLYKFFGITTSGMGDTFDYYTDPYGKDVKMRAETKKNMQEIISGAEDENNEWRPVVPENPAQQDAFLYNVKTLTEAGIPVVIVNQPLHPLYSDKITDESRKNYFKVLNETNVTYYDYEKLFGDECFHDSHHLSWTGNLAYAPYMADLIIQELT